MIRWLLENPETFRYIWAALGILSACLVWNVGKGDTDA